MLYQLISRVVAIGAGAAVDGFRQSVAVCIIGVLRVASLQQPVVGINVVSGLDAVNGATYAIASTVKLVAGTVIAAYAVGDGFAGHAIHALTRGQAYY